MARGKPLVFFLWVYEISFVISTNMEKATDY